MRRGVKVVLLAGGLAVIAAPALAQRAHDTHAPVMIDFRGETSFSPQTCTWNAAGDLEITQDQMRLRAKTMVANRAGGGGSCGEVIRAEADRDVFYVTPNERVRADHAVYDFPNDTVTFTGGVIVVRGQDVASTERLVINVKTNATSMSGGVKAVIYQEQTGQ